MALDDVTLERVDFKVPFGIFLCARGMYKTVEAVTFVVYVPVIEKVIVKECTSHKRALIEREVELFYNNEGEERHAYRVGIYCHTAMLKIFCFTYEKR